MMPVTAWDQNAVWPTTGQAAAGCCRVLELRRYDLVPGLTGRFLEVFEEQLVELQNGNGMHVAGVFRDLGASDRVVWLRGFRSQQHRVAALSAFYSGPIWARHRDETMATLQDATNLMVLRPLRGMPSLVHPGPASIAVDSCGSPGCYELIIDTFPSEHALGGFLSSFHDPLRNAHRYPDTRAVAVYRTAKGERTTLRQAGSASHAVVRLIRHHATAHAERPWPANRPHHGPGGSTTTRLALEPTAGSPLQ